MNATEFAGDGDDVPASLRDPGLDTLWRAVRQRIDRDGELVGRTMAMPHFETRCSPALAALLDRTPTKRLDLGALATGLRCLGLGPSLETALTQLGHPPDVAAVERRTSRQRGKRARQALEESTSAWPEPWAVEWGAGIRGAGLISGLDAQEVRVLASNVRLFVDLLGRDSDDSETDLGSCRSGGSGSGPRAETSADRASGPLHRYRLRSEIAVHLFGSAHALDVGTRLGAAANHVLRFHVGPSQQHLEGRALWEAAGISVDSVSAPVLTWGLRPSGCSSLDQMFHAAKEGRLPLHVSLRSLREHPLEVSRGTPVLVVENPSVVEAAIASRASFGLVCTNGNPSAAVAELLRQLARGGAALAYHGDFDAKGIAICRWMAERGCEPWMMSAADYLQAVERAEADGVQLLRDAKPCGPTPWDAQLETAFEQHRLAVHEESLSGEFLPAFAIHAHAPFP